jgi:hydrogenase expression/formation protein HypD
MRSEVILCSFGDMLRVPGSIAESSGRQSPLGADVRILYSPLDALQLARANPNREVVFFAVGFETTAPANAMAVHGKRSARKFQISRCSYRTSLCPQLWRRS